MDPTPHEGTTVTSAGFEETLLKPQGRVLSTLESDGSRRWLFPRLAKGRFWNLRRLVAYLLIAIFTVIPYVPINGYPAILLDLVHRKLHLMGMTFLPTDTVMLALFMVSFILSIFFITALLGRVWCGWGCPQTVYLEYVFRPIERFFYGKTGVGGKSAKPVPAWRKLAMYAVYLVICLHLANTFLAYFVPVPVLHSWITSSPWNHPTGFLIVMFVTGLMMFDFAYWREQMCIIGCPYGRFQSVLLDKNSMIISYDTQRGEPRGKVSREWKVESGEFKRISLSTLDSPLSTDRRGDCIDCNMCANVCPTGIDIRDGLQIECVACAQCIDACDSVMDKVGLARGLIRYSSQSRMAGEKQRILRPRVVIYSVILTVLLSLLTLLIFTRQPFDAVLVRGKGLPFVVDQQGMVENTWIVKLTNRTDEPMTFNFSVDGRSDIQVATTRQVVQAEPREMISEPVRLIAPKSAFERGKINASIKVTDAKGTTRVRPVHLLGPVNNGGTP